MKKQKSNKKTIILTVIIFVIIGVTAFSLVALLNSQKTDKETLEKDDSTEIVEKPVENDVEKTTEEPDQEKPKKDTGDPTEEKPKIIQNDGDDPNEKNELTGDITFNQVSGDRLTLRINIDQFLTTGKCNLKLTGNQTYSEEADIIPSASTSTCEGFDIPIGKLSSGNWKIEINLESENKKGTILGETNI